MAEKGEVTVLWVDRGKGVALLDLYHDVWCVEREGFNIRIGEINKMVAIWLLVVLYVKIYAMAVVVVSSVANWVLVEEE